MKFIYITLALALSLVASEKAFARDFTAEKFLCTLTNYDALNDLKFDARKTFLFMPLHKEKSVEVAGLKGTVRSFPLENGGDVYRVVLDLRGNTDKGIAYATVSYDEVIPPRLSLTAAVPGDFRVLGTLQCRHLD